MPNHDQESGLVKLYMPSPLLEADGEEEHCKFRFLAESMSLSIQFLLIVQSNNTCLLENDQ